MKVLYFSKRWLYFIWIGIGVLLILVFLVKSKEDSLLTVFSSPATDKVIVIDAGHGGIDPGASGVSGIKEAELNLQVALKLKKYLVDHGAKVIMTRESKDGLASNKSEDMRKRVSVIKESEPDIVISVHMNKFGQSQYYGAQTFYMAGSEDGEKLAKSIQQQLIENLIEGNNRQVKPVNNLLILKAGSAPAVIVECGFLSNANEEALLKTEDYQEKIAWSIYSGIIEYFALEE